MQEKVVGEVEDKHYFGRDFEEEYRFAWCPVFARSSF
jgi:hypothetical protein